MVITECTEDEIDDIVVQGKVKSIDIREDIEVQIDDTNNTNEVKAQAASTDTTTYAWKTAICADKTTDTIGIKGKGVTVGVYDIDTVDKQHSELNNKDITIMDSKTYVDENHGTTVTRILAGSKGIVPKAKVYAISEPNVLEEEIIEKLIKKNVSIINISMSFGTRADDYYTPFEKWIDHISNMHNVLIVNVAGNVSRTGIQCCIGSLAYNPLTVGGLNTNNTATFSDDKFESDSSFGNGNSKGCAKTDCIAAYNDVLGIGPFFSGTSFAAPAVAGVCAQVLQTEPTLAFYPQQIKAIIMASCDRKGSENYSSGLTAKEGSGVVNAFKAIVIASTDRYDWIVTYPYESNKLRDVKFVKREATSKLAISWFVYSTISGTDHSNVNNVKADTDYNIDLSVYSSKGKLLKESTVYNSSSEVVVFNSENDTLELHCDKITATTNAAYVIGIAWY